MPQRLRVFISAPADVPDERLRADVARRENVMTGCDFWFF